MVNETSYISKRRRGDNNTGIKSHPLTWQLQVRSKACLEAAVGSTDTLAFSLQYDEILSDQRGGKTLPRQVCVALPKLVAQSTRTAAKFCVQ